MNSLVRKISLVLAVALSVATGVQAQQLPNRTPGSGANNDPYNSPIHRANPNSRQGTQPVTPPGRTLIAPPTLRKPTLENGGIGNGNPPRQTPRPPSDRAPDSRSR